METYTLSKAAKILHIPKIGRNTIYQILREQGIVDDENRPVQKYVDEGILALQSPIYSIYGDLAEIPVTIVVGERGLDFIQNTVEEYLLTHPKPKVSHTEKSYMWLGEDGDKNYWDEEKM